MIKFFRRIRQQMIKDNRFTKYTLYAIGEIVLVVIGILIALQINSWNTEKNNRELEQQYISRLINELNDEVTRFTALKNGFERQNESVTRLLNFWKDDDVIVQDTVQFWRDFFAGSGAGPWHKEPVIWTQLVQSGELKLIKDQETIEALFNHYADVKSTSDNFNEYPTQTTNEVRKLIATTFAKTDYLLTPGGRVGLPPGNVLEVVLKEKANYRVPFVRVGIIARIHAGTMDRLIESTQKVIARLEKNMDNND